MGIQPLFRVQDRWGGCGCGCGVRLQKKRDEKKRREGWEKNERRTRVNVGKRKQWAGRVDDDEEDVEGVGKSSINR